MNLKEALLQKTGSSAVDYQQLHETAVKVDCLWRFINWCKIAGLYHLLAVWYPRKRLIYIFFQTLLLSKTKRSFPISCEISIPSTLIRTLTILTSQILMLLFLSPNPCRCYPGNCRRSPKLLITLLLPLSLLFLFDFDFAFFQKTARRCLCFNIEGFSSAL